jgi:hypothetical protein
MYQNLSLPFSLFHFLLPYVSWWVSYLAYPNLFGTKGFDVVVVYGSVIGR